MEVMVVTFIIGLSAGLVVMSLPDPPGALDKEAARVEQAMDALADRAVLTGSLYGLQVERSGYAGVRYGEGDWQALQNAAYKLPLGVSMEVTGLAEPKRGADRDAPLLLVFDPSGAPLDAEVVLYGFGERVELSANRAGTEAPE